MRNVSALAGEPVDIALPSRRLSHGLAPPARPAARSLPVLPPEIAFLTAFGVAPGLLLPAAEQARAEAASAEAVLLAGGYVDEPSFYRALARHCGVPFLDGPVQIVASARFPHSIHAGAVEIVPLDGQRWLLAPRGKAIKRLVAAARRGNSQRPDFAITTPKHLSQQVQEHFAAQRLAQASFSLSEADPALSAFHPDADRHALALLGLLLLAGLGAAVSGWLATIVALVCGPIFFLATFARLSALIASLGRVSPPAAALPDHALPVYTLVVPLYDEAVVVADLVRALNALDYPALGSKHT